jgi:hypothetical protein
MQAADARQRKKCSVSATVGRAEGAAPETARTISNYFSANFAVSHSAKKLYGSPPNGISRVAGGPLFCGVGKLESNPIGSYYGCHLRSNSLVYLNKNWKESIGVFLSWSPLSFKIGQGTTRTSIFTPVRNSGET